MSNLIWKYFTKLPLLIISACLLIGLTLGSTLSNQSLPILLSLLAAIVLTSLMMSLLNKNLLAVILSMIVLAGIIYPVVRETIHQQSIPSKDIASAKAIIISAPQISNNRQIFLIDLISTKGVFRLSAQTLNSHNFHLGDKIIVTGTIEEDSHEHSGYLKSQGVIGRIKIDQIVSDLAAGPYSLRYRVLRVIDQLRLRLVDRSERIFAYPESNLINGILLGEKNSLNERYRKFFEKTGTSHILVASGTNVAILAQIILGSLSLVSRRLARITTILALLLFVLLSGADTSIIRASLFYFLIMLADVWGRPVHFPTMILFAAALMTLANPWIVLYDISFQLSFSAIIGLFIFSDWLAKIIRLWPLGEWLAPSLAATLTTMPIIIYYFGTLSLVGPLVNFLIAPLVPIIMIGGLMSLSIPWLAVIPWSIEGVTKLLLMIVQFFASLEWSVINLPVLNWLYFMLSLSVLVVAMIIKNRLRMPRVGQVPQ